MATSKVDPQHGENVCLMGLRPYQTRWREWHVVDEATVGSVLSVQSTVEKSMGHTYEPYLTLTTHSSVSTAACLRD